MAVNGGQVQLERAREEEVEPGEVLAPEVDGAPAVKGRWGTDYLCAACGAVVCAGMKPGMLAGAVFRCRCGALGRVPVPLKGGLLDADDEWLRSFAELHECAKHGELQGPDLAAYRAERDALARTILGLQEIALEPGQRPRRSLRVARLLLVDVVREDGQALRARLTLNVSASGFATVVEQPLPVGAEVAVSLAIPDGEPLYARARVRSAQPREGGVRVGFEFVGLSDVEAERLENLVFETVLGQMRRPA